MVNTKSTAELTALDFLLSVMRDMRQPLEIRIEAAAAALPYTHAELADTEAEEEAP